MILLIMILLIMALLMNGCTQIGGSIDPGDWGYDCVVTYQALGGVINQREVRETYYMSNSYLFEPAGTTNMLIKPVKDGYRMAGWYKAKTDILDASQKVIGYQFKAEDRWDFDEDRIQGDMTLYARWIPQAKVEYVDASTGKVLFLKNITENSPIQRLSAAAELLIKQPGLTMAGYFADQACTVPYDFSSYTHENLIPSNSDLYATMYAEMPDLIEKIDVPAQNDHDANPEKETIDRFINRLGYRILSDDPADRARIRARKDEIVEESIAYYLKNTAEKQVYLKYINGNYIRVSSPDHLKRGNLYGFTDLDSSGIKVDGYILENDIDLQGSSIEMAEQFSGKLIGNGHTIRNMRIRVASRKIDMNTAKKVGLFLLLDGASIENVVFENLSVQLSINSGIDVTVGVLAVEAKNTTLSNVHFAGITIDTGRGDDGQGRYQIADLIARQSNVVMNNVTGTPATIKASAYARIDAYFKPTS